MLRYRKIKANKITEELIDALKIYSYSEGFDIDKIKFACKKFKLYGMSIAKFKKCYFVAEMMDKTSSELISLQQVLTSFGEAYIITTPKMSFVKFEHLNIKVQDHLVVYIKNKNDCILPLQLFLYYNNDKLVNLVEFNGSQYNTKTYRYNYYFYENGVILCGDRCSYQIYNSRTSNTEDGIKTVSNIYGTIKYDKFYNEIRSYAYDDDCYQYDIDLEYDEHNNIIKSECNIRGTNFVSTHEYDKNNNCIKTINYVNSSKVDCISFDYILKRNTITKIIRTREVFDSAGATIRGTSSIVYTR